MITRLTEKEAMQIVHAIVTEAQKTSKNIVVAVADDHGELLAFVRMDKTKYSSINLAINKAWTAARSQKATSELGKALKDPVKGFDISFYGDPKFTGFGGGIPVNQNGMVIGAVAVSGLSQEEDEELAMFGINQVIK
ncbi:MAG: heme-binding protein [Cytophagaceae bacterium]|nr:heme-binding protein [Cytophagaceae bacterium]